MNDARRPVGFRFDEETITILHTLSEHLGVPQTSVLAIAVRLLARREGLELSGDIARGFDGSLYIPAGLKKK